MTTLLKILTFLFWLMTIGQVTGQTTYSMCYIHTVKSQNDKYFLRTIPFDNIEQTSTGKTIVQQTIDTFLSHPKIGIVCVVAQHSLERTNKLIYAFGAQNRQESVRLGLDRLSDFSPEKVLIHDGVRPFVSHKLISSVISKLDAHEAVDVAIPVTDTIKTYDGIVLPRDGIYASQTPQGFDFNLILDLHEQFKEFDYTDDVSIYLAGGGKNLGIVPGSPDNIKITYKSDIK
jgi:2-C-methyl-D-erythritol 4-phosphate cytidylyltransferase/2-C-methyl-D-erythritol 2,4-cyclodiphosphate synthase